MLTETGQIAGAGGALGGSAAIADLQATLQNLGFSVQASGELDLSTAAVLAQFASKLDLPGEVTAALSALPLAMSKPELLEKYEAELSAYVPVVTAAILAYMQASQEPPKPSSTAPTSTTSTGLSPFELLLQQQNRYLPNYKAPLVAQPEPLVIDPYLHKGFFRLNNPFMWAIGAAAAIGGAFAFRFMRK